MDGNLLGVFIQEVREYLRDLEPTLADLGMDKKGLDAIYKIFLSISKIKNASVFFGLDKLAILCRYIENTISLIREGKIQASPALNQALFSCIRKLRYIIDNISQVEHIDIETDIKLIQSFVSIISAVAVSSSSAIPTSLQFFTLDKKKIGFHLSRESSFYVISLQLYKNISAKSKKLNDYYTKIESLGEILDSYFDTSGITSLLDDLNVDLNHRIFFATSVRPEVLYFSCDIPSSRLQEIPREKIQEIIKETERNPKDENRPARSRIELQQVDSPQIEYSQVGSKDVGPPKTNSFTVQEVSDDSILIDSIAPFIPKESRSPSTPHENPVAENKGTIVKKESPTDTCDIFTNGDYLSQDLYPKTKETIRVSVSLLDALMNLAGEMVLGRNQLLRIADKANEFIPGITSVLQNINVVTSEMQEKVMLTRLQPISVIFSRVSRMVRDLSLKFGKEIQVNTKGDEVELDKSILEVLSEPLSQVIRNAVEFSIETPDDRVTCRKPKQGLIHLSAHHSGGQVYIEVVDDGAGICTKHILDRAIELNIIRSEDASNLLDRQILDLIFHPDFSPKEQTHRACYDGLHSIKTSIENLNGSVELFSTEGEGTRIFLKLPLTLAIIPAMMIGVKERRFAIPQVNLVEIVRIDPSHKIEVVRGSSVLRLRGKLLPLVSLEEILDSDYNPNSKESVDSANVFKRNQVISEKIISRQGHVVVLKIDKNHYGLIVDKLYDSEEIVVKPLSFYLKDTQCYIGATLTGDGKVAMILDAEGIANLACLKFDDYEETKGKIGKSAQHEVQAESQTIVLFQNQGEEIFAINLSMVSRLEKITSSQITNIGDKIFFKHAGNAIRLIQLHDFLPVAKMTSLPDKMYVIIPQLLKNPIGIICSKIVDVLERPILFTSNVLPCRGLLGSCIINEKLTLFLDIHQLVNIINPPEPQNELFFKNKKVLVVEDTPFYSLTTSRFLTDFQVNFEVVNNGAQALERINSDHYDLILTDIEMPEMDGLELCRKIRSLPPIKNMPVVALVSSITHSFLERSKEVGLDGYELKLDKEGVRNMLNHFFIQQPVHNYPSV